MLMTLERSAISGFGMATTYLELQLQPTHLRKLMWVLPSRYVRVTQMVVELLRVLHLLQLKPLYQVLPL